ncbi:hypothetical protein WKH56_20835 [Priestia sp. SB1]|uniref:hypothetical protein n=1 Tax=Priestia sp. SB1 TaxID=3132359 RepID=UPI00316F2352
MRTTEYLVKFFNTLAQDETLKRLLIYKPEHSLDDPLDKTKADIGMDWDKIDRVILKSPKTDGMDKKPICRVCMYLGFRTKSPNFRVDTQDIVFDIYSHIEGFDEVDFRLSQIIDRLSELLQDKKVAGVNKSTLRTSIYIANPPSGYVGYRMVYKFGSVV